MHLSSPLLLRLVDMLLLDLLLPYTGTVEAICSGSPAPIFATYAYSYALVLVLKLVLIRVLQLLPLLALLLMLL